MRRVILSATGTIVGLVLLLSFKTSSGAAIATKAIVAPTTSGNATSTGTAGVPLAGDPATSAPTTSDPASAAPSVSPSATAGSSSLSKTVTGDAADTRYGPVQVQITVKNGVITSAQALEYPENDGRDAQINSYAIPVLNQETEQADSASIDMVSGATYTSTGYIQSLQSALNQVG